MANKHKRWIYRPRKPVPPRISEEMREEVTKKANELIETLLKPKYLQPPPENAQFNYIIDIYGKWYRSYFYFCSRYYCPGPDALSPSTSYLGHPFQNEPFESEKDLLSQLANTGGLVYNPKSSSAYSCSNDEILT